jgi:hypothetical protein
MRRLLPLVLTAVALPAQAAPLALPAQAAQASDANRLVALIASDETVVQLAGQLFDAHARDETGLSAETRALFAQDPALKAHVATRVRGEVAAVLRQELPSLRTELSSLVRSRMTPREIADSLAFFSTSTGRKLLASAYRGVGDSGATSEQEAEQAAVTAVMRDLAPEDYSALFTFGASPAAQKFQALRPRISEASRRWGEDVVARHQARLERVGERAIADYRGERKG